MTFNNLIQMIVNIREIALFTRATPGSSLVKRKKGVSCDIKDRLIVSSLADEQIFVDRLIQERALCTFQLPSKTGTGD